MNSKSILCLAISSVLLSACGGGGGSDSPSPEQNVDSNTPETPVVAPPVTDPKPNTGENQIEDPNADLDNIDLKCISDSQELTGTSSGVDQSLSLFEEMVDLKATTTGFSQGAGQFGILGQEIYTFDAYMGKDLGVTEWRNTVPEDILSIKINTSSTGNRQSIAYTNFLNTTDGTPNSRISDKTLIQTTYAPCHGYSQKSLSNPFPTAKTVKVTQRYSPATKQLLVTVQDENDTGTINNSPKQFYIYDVIDVSGKLISDYMPRQILDMARYGVSRFTAYSEITEFPQGSVMLKANSVLVPEQYTGFRMDQVDYFSETFETIEAFNSFITSLSLGVGSIEGAATNVDGNFNLKFSLNQDNANFIQTFDFDRSEALFVIGGRTHAATHQPSTIYKPDFNVDTSELGRSYFNATAGKAIHNLMKQHIYD